MSPGKVFSVEMSDSTAERYHWSVYIHTIQYHTIPRNTIVHQQYHTMSDRDTIQYLYNATQYHPMSNRESTGPSTIFVQYYTIPSNICTISHNTIQCLIEIALFRPQRLVYIESFPITPLFPMPTLLLRICEQGRGGDQQ